MNKNAKMFLRWVTKIYDFKIGDKQVAHRLAQQYCRDKWFEFGERVVKKAINQKDCTSIRKFEQLCLQIKEQNKNKRKLHEGGWYEISNS